MPISGEIQPDRAIQEAYQSVFLVFPATVAGGAILGAVVGFFFPVRKGRS